MQYSKSTSYALHALLYLAMSQRGRGQNTGIKELAASLGAPDSYLSKIMSKLRQDGIVKAVPGASGGYELARPADRISFLEVIQAIEGRQHLYECSTTSDRHHLGGEECLIRRVMDGAEKQMFHYLEEKTIQTVVDEWEASKKG